MFQFIIYLRAICAVIITNAHYEEIYPISIVANGGLLGDVLFFAISGYCLYNIKTDFVQWYGKRILRIYPEVWIITLIYLVLGFYSAGSILEFVKLMIYPTYYHFVASIMILYIIYYVLICILKKHNQNPAKLLKLYMITILVIYIVVYLVVYDKSFYHIDSVYEPAIRFLFLESMLLGAWFREKGMQVTQKRPPHGWVAVLVCFVLYFASKMVFSRYRIFASYQILNQLLLFLLLFFVFKTFAGLEAEYKKLPKILQTLGKNISTITLEIYLVQYALIPRLNILRFPFNFIIVTVGIWGTAMALHWITDNMIVCVRKAFDRKEG